MSDDERPEPRDLSALRGAFDADPVEREYSAVDADDAAVFGNGTERDDSGVEAPDAASLYRKQGRNPTG